MSSWQKKYTGFTLVEMILVLAILFILFSLTSPFYQRYQNKNDLNLAAVSTAQNLRRAQILAQAVDANNSWGVYLQSNSITLFRGPSYASRDSAFDEVINIASSISFSGLSEIIFTKFTGLPTSVGTITLTNINTNDIKSITINDKGTLEY